MTASAPSTQALHPRHDRRDPLGVDAVPRRLGTVARPGRLGAGHGPGHGRPEMDLGDLDCLG